MNRRDILIGGACVAAFGTAEVLRPRRSLRLMPQRPLTDVFPVSFGDWRLQDGGYIVTPKTEGSLADQLYSDTVSHTFRRGGTGPLVMLLAAYGDAQSDLLQLHRPETCYPAVGFELLARRETMVPLAPGVGVPAVAITARAGDRVEDVLYWARLGEYLPTSGRQQVRDRLATAMRGYVADGILVRASVARTIDQPATFGLLESFFASLVRAVPAGLRPALIGTDLSRRIA